VPDSRTIRVDLHAEQGVFQGWGTSLAWWANAVGRWPNVQCDAVIRRIFGLEYGGLGLTVARFNAGGGENPGVEVTMEPRAVMDGYRGAPGAVLDEGADPGQRAVLREAAQVVAESGRKLLVEVFGNSPPWWATCSGSVTGSSTGRGRPAPNLDPVFARDYLRYLHDVADLVERDTSVRVASISPFNEPTSRWWVLGGRQEGCHFTAEGVNELLTELSELPEVARGRTIAASEEWSPDEAVAAWDALGPTARRVVGRLNTHTYDGGSRAAVRARAVRAGIELWVSEYGDGEASGRDLALAIVHDLRELAPSAWVLWQAVSPDSWGVLRLSRDGSSVKQTAKFEVLARFTRSVRPGMTLVGTDDPLSVAATGVGRFSAVVVGDVEAQREVRVDVGTAALGTCEVTIASALPHSAARDALVSLQVEPEGGAVVFALPAGGIASLTAPLAAASTDDGFRGSGTWWLEHESGVRLGLAAAGDDELGAGARVAGVAPDDGALAQRWRAEACGDGSARWVCEASGLQLDIRHASKRRGAHVIQWQAGLAEQAPAHSRFTLARASGGDANLIAQHSGLVLALDASGRGVQRPAGEPGTRWRLVRTIRH
jgi:O-glycosyl hydrolase